MLCREFGSTGWDVSAVSFGCRSIGGQWGEMAEATVEAIVRAAIDGGMNLLDTADSYGIPHRLSEICLGKTLGAVRDDLCLVSVATGLRYVSFAPIAPIVPVDGSAVVGSETLAERQCAALRD